MYLYVLTDDCDGVCSLKSAEGARWPSGRVSDSGARVRGFDT